MGLGGALGRWEVDLGEGGEAAEDVGARHPEGHRRVQGVPRQLPFGGRGEEGPRDRGGRGKMWWHNGRIPSRMHHLRLLPSPTHPHRPPVPHESVPLTDTSICLHTPPIPLSLPGHGRGRCGTRAPQWSPSGAAPLRSSARTSPRGPLQHTPPNPTGRSGVGCCWLGTSPRLSGR